MRPGRELDVNSSVVPEVEKGGAGADAGAGSGIVTKSKTEVEYVDHDAFAHSISRAANTGTVVAHKQTLLKTPGGRLTAKREAEHEKELLAMSERCISLQMQLNEERATVDALTNKAGGLTKKKIAQEAINLRQQLEKKTASLTAIAWKMNELNLINKTFNEKMSNREQHVLYLEEQLVELQNQIGRTVIDRIENEKRLREEIENLRGIVGGMAVPLWQFGEQHIRDVPIASRIIVTASGGAEEEEGKPFKRRRSTGEEEPEPGTQPTKINQEYSDDDSYENDSEVESRVPVQKGRSNFEDSFEDSYNSADDDSMYSDYSGSSRSRSSVTIGSRSFQSSPSRSTTELSLKHASLKKSLATLQLDKKQYATAEVQTDEVQVYDMSVRMVPEEIKVKVETRDGEAQTDEVEKVEAVCQTDRVEVSLETRSMETQTNPTPEMRDAEVMTDRPKMSDTGMMTEEEEEEDGQSKSGSGPAKEYANAGSQTEPKKVMDGGEAKEIVDAQVQTDPIRGFGDNNSFDSDVDGRKARVAVSKKTKEVRSEKRNTVGKEQSEESNDSEEDDSEEDDSEEDDEEQENGEEHSEESYFSEDGLEIPETIPEGIDESERSLERSPKKEKGKGVKEKPIAEESIILEEMESQTKSMSVEPNDETNEEKKEKEKQEKEKESVQQEEQKKPSNTNKAKTAASRFCLDDENSGPPTTMQNTASKFMLEGGPLTRTKTDAVSKFMLDNNASDRKRNTGAAVNKFMPGDQMEVSSKRQAKRRFLFEDDDSARSPTPGASRYIMADIPSTLADKSVVQPEDMASQTGLNAEDDYDDLGKRWGVSDSELAADTAVLNKILVDTGGLLGEGDEESDSDDMNPNGWDLNGGNLDGGDSLDDEEALFENAFEPKMRRTASQTSQQEIRLNRSNQFSQSDDRDTAYAADFDTDDGGGYDESADSIDHDEFDRMMNETAAALAAADDLDPESGEDDTDQDPGAKHAGVADETSDDASVPAELKQKQQQSIAREQIIEDDSDDESLFNDEGQQEDEENEEGPEEIDSGIVLDPSMLEGGRSVDYVVKRFTLKKASLIIPGLSQAGKKGYVYPEPDELSVLSRITMKSSTREGSMRESSYRDRKKKSSRSESRHREEKKADEDDKKKKRKKKHSSHSDDRKKSSERDDDKKRKKKKHSSDRKSSRKK